MTGGVQPHPGRSSVKVEQRPLTDDEANRVISEIRDVDTITGYSKSEWTRVRETHVVVKSDGELAAAALVHHLWAGWSEVAVLYVLPGDRGQGFAGLLLGEVLEGLRVSGRRPLIFFCSSEMRRIVRACGFEVYDSVSEVPIGAGWPGLYLRRIYKWQWLARPYRVSELIRKRVARGVQFNFEVGAITRSSV